MTPGGPTPTPRPFSAVDSPFTPERLSQAAWSGVLAALVAFGILALYGILRLAVRGELRGGWQQVWAEYVHPLINSLRRRR